MVVTRPEVLPQTTQVVKCFTDGNIHRKLCVDKCVSLCWTLWLHLNHRLHEMSSVKFKVPFIHGRTCE